MKFVKKQTIYLLIVIIVAGIVGWGALIGKKIFQPFEVTNFQQCVSAGFPIQETYPQRCIAKDGKSFVNTDSIIPDKEIEIKGEIVCLPKKGDGPHTLECAYGLKSEDGLYFALMGLDPYTFTDTGEKILVKGVVEASGSKTSYDIAGSIIVSQVKKY